MTNSVCKFDGEHMTKRELMLIGSAIVLTAVTGVAIHAHINAVLMFVMTAVALVLVAMIVGEATDQLGSKMGPAATGILQSALGNLPELFVCIFALRAGLDEMVKAALIGSILGNSLLVFGLAILLGGLKNGRQHFHSEPPKLNSILMLLAFAAMAIPTLVYYLHTPAAPHIDNLDIGVAAVLLLVFAGSLVHSIRGDASLTSADAAHGETSSEAHGGWSLPLTLAILAGAGVAAAFVSDWFVQALKPAMDALGINEVFAGLIVVAIAGNAIENLVGIQLALRNKSDYAVSVIMNSSLQIALVVYPVLVLLSFVLGGVVLSFVLSPMLLVAYALAVLTSAFIVFDGESIWMEGVALIGLYLLIAFAFWWG